jgi:hypothetical protein
VTGSAELKHFSSSESLYFCKSQTGKLETVRLRRIQPVINALMRELTHMVFSLQCGFECPIANIGPVTVRFFDGVSLASLALSAHDHHSNR